MQRNIPSDELYDACTDDQKHWIDKNYKGWEHLVRPCIDRAITQGHEIQQIKAKFGSLRFYWFPKTQVDPLDESATVKVADPKMNELVKDAECRSMHTCTSCGAEDDAIQMGYCNLCKDGWIDRLGKEFGLKRKEP